MGGKSSEQKQLEATNTQTSRENVQRSYDYDRASAENEASMRSMQYNMNLESNRQAAGFEAAQRVTEERADAIRMSGDLLTDFERQEKRRLMEAKKGVGQVTDADFAISEEDRQGALSLLEKPEEYWEARRKKAYDSAAGGAGSSYGGYEKFISSGAAAKKWEATKTASQEAGAAYQGSGGGKAPTSLLGSSRSRDQLLGLGGQ